MALSEQKWYYFDAHLDDSYFGIGINTWGFYFTNPIFGLSWNREGIGTHKGWHISFIANSNIEDGGWIYKFNY